MHAVGDVFAGVFGNDSAKMRFASAIRSNTLPHAFLLDGPPGSGKKTLAYEIAAALNCENGGSGILPFPCRRCNTCRRIFSGSYTDIKVLCKPSDRATIGVDTVKDFKSDMFLTASESDFKIYIIEDAHLLTPQAQNALLTVMEEPPPRVIIFLLSSSSDKILTTIKSRAQYVAMQKFTREELETYLKRTVPDAISPARISHERLCAVLTRADGCIGRALALLDPKSAEEAEERHAAVMKFVSALDVRASFADIYSALSDMPTGRAELISSVEEMISAVSDMIKVKHAQGEAPTLFFETAEDAENAARPISRMRLFKIYGALNEAHEYLTQNAMTASVISSLAARIKLF